jgi:hypothetical protein
MASYFIENLLNRPVKFVVFKAVNMKIKVFWAAEPYSLGVK